MSVEVTAASTLTTVETYSTSDAPAGSSAANRSVTHDGYNFSSVRSASTTVPVTKCAYFSKALAAGVATIDLTALTHMSDTVDFTGLKVQEMRFYNRTSTNHVITVSKGAANGYTLNAAATTWTVSLDAGCGFTWHGNDLATDVAAGAKNIDLAGTLTEEIEVSLVAG